jgi:hypothetical protein
MECEGPRRCANEGVTERYNGGMRLRRFALRRQTEMALLAVAVAAAGCATSGGTRPATSSRQAAAPCATPVTDPAQVVDANRPAQDPQVLSSVGAGLCLSEVLDRLGPAHRYVASSLFQFEWMATDGRVFQVGFPSLRDKTVYAHWAK